VALLVSVAEVKARLRLPTSSDPVQDPVIEALLSAIQSRVLELCGFLLTDDPYFTPVQRTDQLSNVQLGVPRFMRYRPLLPMSSDPAKAIILKARSLASSTYNDIIGDIQDPREGKVIPLASELTPVFPPVGGQAPWWRWRQMIWPFVKFTYLVDVLGSDTNPLPPAIPAAILEWTASIYTMPGAGRLKTFSFSAEKISESYGFNTQKSMPEFVAAMLAPYIRGTVGLIF